MYFSHRTIGAQIKNPKAVAFGFLGCVSDLDVRGFYGGSKPPPYAMMGVALDRCLPGRNAMLATTTYVINILHTRP